MAKKSSKKQTRSTPAPRVEAPATSAPAGPATSIPAGGRSYDTEFNPDYSQTIKDLRRIGILAGTFFSILVILAFFLR
jgi:hypothetical protein